MKKLKILVLLLTSFLYASDDKLVVGMASGYAPYVSLNERGEYEGFDIDLANMVAQRLNRKLVLQDLGSMPSLLVALKKKKIDAIMWAMSITEERQKDMDMVYYQGEIETQIPFVFWGKVPENLSKIEDLRNISNCTVCCEAGSYQDSILNQYSGIKVKYVDKISDVLMELKYRKAQTAAIDSSLIQRVKTQYPEIKVAYLPLPQKQQSFGNGICLNKEVPNLTQSIKDVVVELTKEGKIKELEEKWGLSK